MSYLTARRIVHEEIKFTSEGAATEDVSGPLVPEGHIMEVRHSCVENETTAYTRLVLGMKRGGQFIQKEEQDSPTADDIFWSDSRFMVPARHQWTARMTGNTNLDKITFNYEGVLYKVGEELCRK